MRPLGCGRWCIVAVPLAHPHLQKNHPASLRTLHLPVRFPLLLLLLPAPLGTFPCCSHAAPVATPLPRVSPQYFPWCAQHCEQRLAFAPQSVALLSQGFTRVECVLVPGAASSSSPAFKAEHHAGAVSCMHLDHTGASITCLDWCAVLFMLVGPSTTKCNPDGQQTLAAHNHTWVAKIHWRPDKKPAFGPQSAVNTPPLPKCGRPAMLVLVGVSCGHRPVRCGLQRRPRRSSCMIQPTCRIGP